MNNFSHRNFTLNEVIHQTNAFPAELLPIAYTAMGDIQRLRDYLSFKMDEDIPLVITSGYRSPKYNKTVGGSKNSHHVWRIVDNRMIYALDFYSPKLRADILYDLARPVVQGETYLHREKQFVHMSVYGPDEEWII